MPQEIQELKVHKVLQVLKVPQEIGVHKELLEQLGHKGHKELKKNLDLKGRKEREER